MCLYVTEAIKNKIAIAIEKSKGLYGWGNLSGSISGFIIWLWPSKIKMPVQIDSVELPFLLENPVVATQTLINTAILTRNVTIKSSFMSRMCFHTQIYINLAREMKNKVKIEYQSTTLAAHAWKWHISSGSGPNHILKLVIPHTIIPYKAPCEKKLNLSIRSLKLYFEIWRHSNMNHT